MKKTSILILVLASLFILASRGYAGEDVWTMAKSDKYGTKVQGMLGRGLLNVATCFVDLIQHTVEGTQDGPPFVGTLTGLGSGIGCSALRVSSGALDVVSFWVPEFNGIPVSKSYSNCLELEEESAASAASEQVAAQAPAGEPQATVVTPTPGTHRRHSSMKYVKK